jgi:ribosomal-protein-alanine N-acetyltransferase
MQEASFSIEYFTDSTAAPVAAAMHARCFSTPWSKSDFMSALGIPGTMLQILHISGEPAAFSLYRIIMDEVEILTLGTLPEFRGKGVAKQLLGAAIERLRETDARVILLEVGSQNLVAKRLYTAEGFEEIGRRKNYYNHGGKWEDAIMMKKIL